MREQKSKGQMKYALLGAAFTLLIGIIIGSSSIEAEPEKPKRDLALVYSPFMPDTISFCGEEVPVNFFDVFESLERELITNTYYHSQTLQVIKRSRRYFPIIEPILEENGIPDDFKYLAVIESNLSNAVSPAGASGIWQLMPGTAKDYGLEVNNEIDERYHLEKACQAACKYLKDSYQKLNSWTLVAASYNVGRRGVTRQMERQKEDSYYDLLFNEETARYVYRIIAMKAIMEQPWQYGFMLSEKDKYQAIPFSEVEVNSAISNWAEFAQENATNYKMLKYLNPWLKGNSLTNASKSTYMVKLPKKKSRVHQKSN